MADGGRRPGRWSGLAARLVFGVALGVWGGDALAECGDGVRDGVERCDHGSANGTDGCCSATCDLVDSDADAVCDAQDPCSDLAVVPIEISRLRITRLGGPVGDETFRFSGSMTVAASPAIDPATHGLRLVVTDHAVREVVLDVSIQGGPGWRRTSNGAAWRYRPPSGDSGSVTRVEARVVTVDPPTLAVVVQGRGAASDVVPYVPYVLAALAIDADAAVSGQCGESILTASRCRLSVGGRLSCKPVPPIRVCAGDSDALTACDARNCASAQERYFVARNTYYSGDCEALAGFVASPDVFSSTAGTPTDFTVVALHVPTGRICNWESAPVPGTPELTCFD